MFRRRYNDRLPKVYRWFQIFFAEFFASIILMFVGCLACLPCGNMNTQRIQCSLGFGCAILLGMHIFGPISGSHINPIVTGAYIALNKLEFLFIPAYICGQFLGCLIGYLISFYSVPKKLRENEKMCYPVMHPDLSVGSMFSLELIASTCYVLAMLIAIIEFRERVFSMRIGFSIIGLTVALHSLTGCILNPFRILMPCIWLGIWDNHWVYWVPQCVACLLAAAIYKCLYEITIRPKDEYDGY